MSAQRDATTLCHRIHASCEPLHRRPPTDIGNADPAAAGAANCVITVLDDHPRRRHVVCRASGGHRGAHDHRLNDKQRDECRENTGSGLH
ncbi:hypothetical protein ASC67_09710 [Methylibium sp. Root1272]|nr:hypothetical protein ASC67_09710 [Methylibium sp. Root1272]